MWAEAQAMGNDTNTMGTGMDAGMRMATWYGGMEVGMFGFDSVSGEVPSSGVPPEYDAMAQVPHNIPQVVTPSQQGYEGQQVQQAQAYYDAGAQGAFGYGVGGYVE